MGRDVALRQGLLPACRNKAAGQSLGEDWLHAWRVEEQLSRPVLNELHTDSLEALYENLASLWRFITEGASLRLRDIENTTCRTVHSLWAVVQAAEDILGDPGLALRRLPSDAISPVFRAYSHISSLPGT